MSRDDLSRLAAILNLRTEQLLSAPSLVIKNRGFSEIPEALSLLSNLVELDMSDNDLRQIPKFLATLTSLERLILSRNRLTVLNGDGLGPALVHIDLNGNAIESIQPSFFNVCTGLTFLSLQTNRLSQLPAEISELHDLVELQVKENRISSLPKEIGALTNLQRLYVQKNALSELPPEVSRLSSITCIYAYRNSLTALPDTLQHCTNLQDLYVYDNQISRIPAEILSLDKLVALMISSNSFHSVVERIYESYTKNRGIVLDLSYMKLASVPKEHIEQEIGLIGPKTLDLSNNYLREIPTWLFEKDEFQDLSSIVLDKNCLKDLPPSICALNLQNLSLHGNMQMNPQLQKEYKKNLTKKTSALEKCLHLIQSLRRFGPRNTEAIKNYEAYAIKILNRAVETNTLDQVLKKHTLSLAVRANAFEFLSHEKVAEYVDALWVNNADFTKYLASRYKRVHWFELGFRDGMGCIWKSIRDIGAQRLHSPKTIYYLYSLCYVVYVLLLTVMIISQNVSYVQSSFFFSSSIQKTFEEVKSVQTESQLWDYMNNSFFSTVYEGPYADTPPSTSYEYEDHPYSNYFRIVGPIRFRQQRAPYKPCSSLKPSRMGKKVTDHCVPPLSDSNEETSDYGNGLKFKWESQKHTGSDYEMGSIEFWYPGSGHTYYFSSNVTKNKSELEVLINAGFVDPQTRVLFLEFIVSNDNLDLVSFVRLMFEFPASGSIITSVRLNTLTKNSFNYSFDGPFGFQICILVYTIGFIFHEIQQFRGGLWKYLKYFWNYFDVFAIILLIIQICVHFSMARDDADPSFDLDCYSIECFQNLFRVSTLYNMQKAILSILCIISWIRLLFLFSIQEDLGPMNLGVAYMLRDMITFLAIFAVFMVGFGLSLFTLLATNISDFSTLRQSGFSIVLYLMGNFELESVSNVSPVLGPLFLIMFVIICVILLMNFLIAILSGTYEENQANASKRYRLLFTETVISLSESPLPSPINLLYPLWYVIGPLISNYWETHFASKTHHVRNCENSLEQTIIQYVSQSRDKTAVSFISNNQCSILSKFPWENDGLVHYFEVEVLCPGVNYIGLVYADYPRDLVPGRKADTFGFSSYSGGFFQGDKQLSFQVSNLWNKVGDVVGCGIDFEKKMIFLTHQGTMAKSMFPLDTDSAMFPAIGLWNFGSALRVNFGDRPFKFTGLDDWPHFNFQDLPEPKKKTPYDTNENPEEIDRANYFPQKVPKSLQVSPDGLTVSYCNENFASATPLNPYSFVSSAYEWRDDDTSRYSMKVEILNPGRSGSVAIGILSRLSQKHHLLDKDSKYLCLQVFPQERKCHVRNKLTGSTETEREIPWIFPTGGTVEVEVGVCFLQKRVFIRFSQSLDLMYSSSFDKKALRDLYPTIGLSSVGQCTLFSFCHDEKVGAELQDLEHVAVDNPVDDPMLFRPPFKPSPSGRRSIFGQVVANNVRRSTGVVTETVLAAAAHRTSVASVHNRGSLTHVPDDIDSSYR